MECVTAGDTAHFVLTARRNNSLSSSGRLLVFGVILAVSLGIALAFAWVLGAWLILPFTGVETVVLYLAFRDAELHSGDYERLAMEGDRLNVEVVDGGRMSRRALNRGWAQVVCAADGSDLALRSHGREFRIGRHMNEERRLATAWNLRRVLRSAS